MLQILNENETLNPLPDRMPVESDEMGGTIANPASLLQNDRYFGAEPTAIAEPSSSTGQSRSTEEQTDKRDNQ
jgi:hypothetical protein